MENVYLARLWKLSGSPAAHPINSSALPDKLFNPRHQPIIFYVFVKISNIFIKYFIVALSTLILSNIQKKNKYRSVDAVVQNIFLASGGVPEWLTRRTSNLRIAGLQVAAWVQTLSWTSRCFLERVTLHSLLSTSWFQERIRVFL